MARITSHYKWGVEVSSSISVLEKFIQGGNPNLENKVYLLKAEAKSLLDEKEDALAMYEMAIAAANNNAFIHEHAIA
eukprot:12599255-Ditylum_brightwellii.AAC.1